MKETPTIFKYFQRNGMNPDYRKTPGQYRTEGTDIQRFSVSNPLIYLSAKEQDLKNKIRNNTGQTITPPYVPTAYTIPLDDSRRLYATIGMGVNGSGDAGTWLQQSDTSVATFQGNPKTGTRAYKWESNPSDPDTSSPWHNVIYERTIDLYNWGSRAFFLYMPFGSFNYTFFLTAQTWKRTYKSSSNPSTSPARWKGFVQAVKGLLEGTLAPVGKTAMSEPCNVCIYHPSNRGYYNYRSKSNELWDSLDGNADIKDQRYYEYLDDWLNSLIAIKSSDSSKGKFSIILDATSPSATPSTISLYRTMPDYRSDMLELSDWYVFNKLRDAGIDVYYESRAPKTVNVANIPGTGSGTTGSYLTNDWYNQAFAGEEYWYWFSNPSNSDTNFDNFASDTDAHSVFRLVWNNFPLPANKDPYGVNFTTFTYGGQTINFTSGGPYNTLYTPHWAVWSIYALSDNYRKYTNIKENSSKFKGIKGQTPNQIAYSPEWIVDGDMCISVYNGVDDPLLSYWRLDTATLIHYRPMFNDLNYTLNPSGYTGGFWTQDGKDYWDSTVRASDFSKFIAFLDSYSSLRAPSGSGAQYDYGSVNDTLYRGVLDYE